MEIKVLIFFLCLFTKLGKCIVATISPPYCPVPEFKSGSAQFFITLKTSMDPSPLHTFTFSTAFGAVPKVAYGIQSYAGDDGANPFEQFELQNFGLSATSLILKLIIGSSTNLHYFSASYIAIDWTFLYHANTFQRVPINYAGALSNITGNSNTAQYFEYTIDYNSQSLGAGFLHTSFNQISTGRVIPFMNKLHLANYHNPALFEMQLCYQIVSTTSYKLRVDISGKSAITALQFSMLIFDVQQIQQSGVFKSVDGKIQKNNHKDETFLLQASSLTNALIVSFTYWRASRADCALIFLWGSTSVSGTFQISLSTPAITGGFTAACSLLQLHSYYFYMKKICCPISHPYANITSQVCQDSCYDGFYPDLAAGYCVPCVSPCLTCTTLIACASCVSGLYRSIVGTSCDCISGYYDSGSPTCSACSSVIVDCSQCSTPGVTCTACTNGKGVDSSTNTCVDCATYNRELSAGVCTTCLSGYYQDAALNLLCQSCSLITSDCFTCIDNLGVLQCASCTNGKGLDAIALTCIDCSTMNRELIAGVCSTCSTGFHEDAVNNTLCIDCGVTISNCDQCHYNSTAVECTSCVAPDGLHSPTNACVDCSLSNRVLLGQNCVCQNGFFEDAAQSLMCVACNTQIAECTQCIYDGTHMPVKCLACDPGFTVDAINRNDCDPCSDSNCATCQIINLCTLCFPGYITSHGQCQDINCAASCTCIGYANINGVCQNVCGDGLITIQQQCDDSNSIEGDGCSSNCKVQEPWVCAGEPSCCLWKDFKFSEYKIIKNPQANQITIHFEVFPTDSELFGQNVIVNSIQTNISTSFLRVTSVSYEKPYIIAEFQYSKSLHNQTIAVTFSPVSQNSIACSSGNSLTSIFSLLPNNNVPVITFKKDQYEARKISSQSVKAVAILSYIALGVSLVVGKIAGLQLFGVLQFAFFSLAQQDNVNIILSPILQMKFLNGFNPLLSKDQASVPKKVSALDYDADFIHNFNIMLLTLVLALVTGSILLTISSFASRFSERVAKWGKYVLKEIFLTLMLFCSFNIGFCLGLQVAYSKSTSQSFGLSVFAAVVVILMIGFLLYLLSFTSNAQFGQFKQKFKNGFPNKLYFHITIVYRISLGMYIAIMNQYDISTLIVISFSIFFIIYNFVNLPFKDAYQNYRANMCHLTQLYIMFTTMYYTSMKKYDDLEQKVRIYSPASFEIALLFFCLIFTYVCLSYQGYLWFKNKTKQPKDKTARKALKTNTNQQTKNEIQAEKKDSKINIQLESLGNIKQTEENIFAQAQIIYEQFQPLE